MGIAWCRADMCVLITAPKALFAFDPYFRSLIPQPPVFEDYRFVALRDRNRHDVLIHCLDGTISASKEALYHVSMHFRTWPQEMVENASCQAVDELLCFMMTGTWSHPGEMSRKHVDELLQLIKKYKPLNTSGLLDAVHHHLLWQLYENRHDLRHVLEIFMIAYPDSNGFAHLRRMATAVIGNFRNEYMLEFSEPMTRNEADHELITSLHAPLRDEPDTSIHEEILDIFADISRVQLIIDNEKQFTDSL